jgi:hypothetical protein
MNKYLTPVLAFVLTAGFAGAARAADAAPTTSPTILRITQEAVRPGKYATLAANKATLAQAWCAAGSPRISIALKSLTGPDEVWTLEFLDGLGDLESDLARVAQTPALRARVAAAAEAEAEYLAQRNIMTALFLKDLSYQPAFDWAQARFLDVITVHVRPGHHLEYLELRRMSVAAHNQGGLDGPLHVFKVNTGTRGLTWLIVRPLKSLREHDALRAKGFGEPLTAEQDRKMVELRAASMESAEEQFFRVEPGLSLVPAAWAQNDPGFWIKR